MTITKPTQSDIDRTSAKIQCTTGNVPTAQHGGSFSVSFIWTPSGGGSQSTTVTATGLTPGSSNLITISCSMPWSESWTNDEQIGVDKDGNPIYENKSYSDSGTNSDSKDIKVYTQPEEFKWDSGVAVGQTIQASNALTATKWNELRKKTGQWSSWKNQEDNYNSVKGSDVNSGDVITADAFNAVGTALEYKTTVTNDHTQDSSLIKASLFTDLQDKINNL